MKSNNKFIILERYQIAYMNREKLYVNPDHINRMRSAEGNKTKITLSDGEEFTCYNSLEEIMESIEGKPSFLKRMFNMLKKDGLGDNNPPKNAPNRPSPSEATL